MENAIGQSELNNGNQVEAGKNLGKVSVNSQAAIDKSAFVELNKEFKDLNKHIATFKADLPALINDTKKWATELGKVARQMKAIGASKGGGGGGGSSYMPGAGEGATNVNSGNTYTVQKTVNYYEAPAGGGGPGGGGPTPPNTKAAVWDAVKNLAGQAIGAMDARAARGAQYSLSADRMNMLYQQTTGLSQNQVYHQYRAPLQQYKLGMGGINTLLGLQASTGLNAQQQAGSVEALRAASGYAYSTEDVAGMTKSLASAQTTNQMFMMLGTGMYGIGGKQRTAQQVYQDVISRTGLNNEKMLEGAFQQGSMTRARLSMAGIADDQQDLVLQMAQQNIAFKKKGGKGNYDQSNKAHRELMGVEGNYANQAEETARVQAGREENFYKRQNDNFADFEKATQNVTKALQAFEEKLSGIAGANISTKPYQNAGKSIMKWGKRIAGVGLMAAGVFGSGFTAGTSLALTTAGASLAASAGGDPIDGLRRRRGSGVWGVRTNNEAGGDPGDGSNWQAAVDAGITESQLSANNKRKLAQLDQKLRVPLTRMLLANPRLEIGDAVRSSAQQETSFRQRYKKAPPGVTQKTSENDRIWKGEVWIHQRGHPMAPPGQSMHEIGLAADLSQEENEWVRANAASFGLRHGGTSPGLKSDEPFHVQPASVPMGRAQYESGEGISSSPTDTAGSSSGEITRTRIGSTGTGVSGSATSTYLPSPSTFQFAGMSMGEVIGVGSVYATSNLKSASRASGSYPSASAGGDPIDSNSIVRQTTVSAGNSYNITVSPNVNIHTSGNNTSDLRKMAKEVANILEQEIRMTAMRAS
jgi:hypothetical protein